jgi:hypothetical protein
MEDNSPEERFSNFFEVLEASSYGTIGPVWV